MDSCIPEKLNKDHYEKLAIVTSISKNFFESHVNENNENKNCIL